MVPTALTITRTGTRTDPTTDDVSDLLRFCEKEENSVREAYFVVTRMCTVRTGAHPRDGARTGLCAAHGARCGRPVLRCIRLEATAQRTCSVEELLLQRAKNVMNTNANMITHAHVTQHAPLHLTVRFLSTGDVFLSSLMYCLCTVCYSLQHYARLSAGLIDIVRARAVFAELRQLVFVSWLPLFALRIRSVDLQLVLLRL